jgi:hypothetical protein
MTPENKAMGDRIGTALSRQIGIGLSTRNVREWMSISFAGWLCVFDADADLPAGFDDIEAEGDGFIVIDLGIIAPRTVEVLALLRDSDRDPEGAETAQAGSVAVGDSAGPKDIAHPSHGEPQ